MVLRDCEASTLGNGAGRGTNGLRIHLADTLGIDRKAVVTNLLSFLWSHDVAATVGEFSLDLFIDFVNYDTGLLRGANDTIIESLGVDDRRNSVLDVAELVDDGTVVTWADADSWLAR